MPIDHTTEFAARFRRVAAGLGYLRGRHLDCPGITDLVRRRNRFTVAEWGERRVYRIATGRQIATWRDVKALTLGLEVEPWELLWDRKPRVKKFKSALSELEELLGPFK